MKINFRNLNLIINKIINIPPSPPPIERFLLIVVHPVSSFDAEDTPAGLRDSPTI